MFKLKLNILNCVYISLIKHNQMTIFVDSVIVVLLSSKIKLKLLLRLLQDQTSFQTKKHKLSIKYTLLLVLDSVSHPLKIHVTLSLNAKLICYSIFLFLDTLTLSY